MRRVIDTLRWWLLRYTFAIAARHIKARRYEQGAAAMVLGMRWGGYTRVVASAAWKPESAE